MRMNSASERLPRRDIVLLGAGHTNAHIIRMWRMHALPETRLTCVSNQAVATYSGMLSGVLAGQYPASRMEIDLVRLCASCGVRFIQADATGLDHESQLLLLDTRPPIPFDALSIGIGSKAKTFPGCEFGLSIKPMQTFLHRLEQSLEQLLSSPESRTLRIAIVGGGAAGVEIACCLPNFVAKLCGSHTQAKYILVERSSEILSNMPKRTRSMALGALAERKVEVNTNHAVLSANASSLRLENREPLAVDLIIWATSATAHNLLANFGLPLDDRGFLLTRDSLQSVGNDSVFAVGDAGTVQDTDYAKAGVYAVRQAPVLWENLRHYLEGGPLEQWRPQKTFLSLLNTGDGRAIATYRGWSAHAKWSWWLKDRIDSRFMDKYQDYSAPAPMETTGLVPDSTMPCGGCGSKVPASVLAESLPTIHNPQSQRVLSGIESPDDAALVQRVSGDSLAVTADFFTAFLDDPYLLGRIAALNALNDLHVKGVTPSTAVTLAVLPYGPQSQQSQLLRELLDGAAREFQESQVTIVGGHTIAGPQLTFGFTLLGDTDASQFLRNSTPSPGDKLILTKALGTGILLAAHMRAACPARWWEPLLETMLESNLAPAITAHQLGASAATDVSGFGLAGHLLEMLTPKQFTAELKLSRVPLLPGTRELLELGVESTLTPSNRESFANACEFATDVTPPSQAVLFDPQTSGGLLIAIAKEKAKEYLDAAGPTATEIGTIQASDEDGTSIRIIH